MLKADLRNKYKALRKELSSQDLEQMSVEIFDRLTENFDLNEKNISIFLPIKRFNEINTWPILNLNATFCLPVVEKEGLRHIIYENREQIEVSDWGIPEPIYGNEMDVKLIDIVLVPLLAYDQNGNRVGYGKGFYDSFLAQCNDKCQFIGLSYFQPEQEIEGVFEQDIPLHQCITPKELIKF